MTLAAAVLVVGIVGVAVATRSGGTGTSSRETAAREPSVSVTANAERGGRTVSSDRADNATRVLVGTAVNGREHDCIAGALERDADLVAGVEAMRFDTAQAAELVVGCTSAETLASIRVGAYEAFNITVFEEDCIMQELLLIDAEMWNRIIRLAFESPRSDLELGELESALFGYCFA